MKTNSILSRLTRYCLQIGCFVLPIMSAFGQKLQLTEKEYFETQGLNLLVFSSEYNGMFFDEKTAGIEMIHHGVRTSTGGAVRLQNTPEQWDLVPKMTSRKVDKATNSIEVTLRYKEVDFDSRVTVKPKDKGVEISVYLDKPLPEKVVGKAGFNLEFVPSAYFEKSYLADGKPGIFPLYPASNTKTEPLSQKIQQFGIHNTFEERGKPEFIVPGPLASGKTLVLAPEDAEHLVKVQSETELMLFDGRNLAQNGWFIVRSLLPAGKTGKVLTWYLEPNVIPNWKRAPVIQFSQVGYNPRQEKIAVFELDKADTPLAKASLFQVTADGKSVEKMTGAVTSWGQYLRYNYGRFDFSAVKDPGVYFIQYGNQKTNTFPIAANVYKTIGDPTLDVWFPVQMDHMMVNEAYRVWHGVPFKDDALQAPLNQQHFDGYSMGNKTDTKYKPYERIPGLGVGGWFDAGDFDIQTGSHNTTILNFVDAWEKLKINRDETWIDQAKQYVDIHRPDGKPDVLQQIEHGTLNLVAQVKNIGHPVRGIIVPNLHQYHHLGDANTETDNLPYNPNLKPYESDGKSSGTMDDRWAFTTRSAFLDYNTAAALAAASRALKGYNDTLSTQALLYAKKLWDENDGKANADTSRFATMFRRNTEMSAALQLYITTREDRYAQKFKAAIWPALDRPGGGAMTAALQAYPLMDKEYQTKLKDYVVKLKAANDELIKQNPYGVPAGTRGGWGSNQQVISWAITNYHAHTLFPDIISPEYVYRGLNYIFGCHPYHNLSFVSAVGTRSKKITYGSNRADFSYIAGGVVPGIIVLKPDFPENREDWPFLWGENEVIIDICSAYILLSGAANELANK